MRKYSAPALCLLAVSVILACNLRNLPASAPAAPLLPPANTPGSAGTQQATPTQSSARGTKISVDNVSLIIPEGLASGATTTRTTHVEMPPFVNPSNGPMPQHIVISLQGYPLTGEATIAVFKAAEYSDYSPYTKVVVAQLKGLNFETGGQIPAGLDATFLAEAGSAPMQDGHGLRYLTQVMEAEIPISNDQLYYYYQGLSKDDTYFVMAVLPVNAPFLAPNSTDKAVPAGGVAFPPFTNPSASTAEIQAYYKAVQAKLNSDSKVFNPPLTSLDALIRSISVTP